MFHVKPPQGRKFSSLRRFIICSIYYNFTGYFNPLNGLKAISAYSENSAETKQIPSTTRIAVRFEKQIKYRRLKPVNEYTPPHMPKIMRLTRQIPAESLIPKLCAKTCNIMNCCRQAGLRPPSHGKVFAIGKTFREHCCLDNPWRYEQYKEREHLRRGVYFGVNDPRKAQRDNVMRSIYKEKRTTLNLILPKPPSAHPDT